MSRTKLNDGRINQKKRTRKALLDATVKMVNNGLNPTIDEIAEQAEVSRATAYRYFPNIERLLLEASLDKNFLSVEVILKDKKQAGSAEKMVLVHDYLFDFVAENETGFRLFIRACMDEWVTTGGKSEKYLRGARRLILIDEALKKSRPDLSDEEYRKLRHTLAAMTSVEAYIALRDVCQLSADDAKATMGWSVKKLINAILVEKHQ